MFSLLLLSGSAFAVTPGYNPETGEIILPSEAALYENNASTQTDLAEIQAAEAQYKALQEAAEETANIQLWEKLDKEMKLRRYDKLVISMKQKPPLIRLSANRVMLFIRMARSYQSLLADL